MLRVNTEDLQYIFDLAGETVLINDVERQAIITNPAMSEYEERYLHTLDKVNRGNLVTIEGERYLVLTESITKRGSKYKTLIRHCNYIVEIKNYDEVQTGVDNLGRPVYKYVYAYSNFIPSIVDNKTFSVDLNQAINVADNQIEVIVQDNELNRTKLAINISMYVASKKWKVVNQDFSKNGLLILTCEFFV